jgi:hypothetical protein
LVSQFRIAYCGGRMKSSANLWLIVFDFSVEGKQETSLAAVFAGIERREW